MREGDCGEHGQPLVEGGLALASGLDGISDRNELGKEIDDQLHQVEHVGGSIFAVRIRVELCSPSALARIIHEM